MSAVEQEVITNQCFAGVSRPTTEEQEVQTRPGPSLLERSPRSRTPQKIPDARAMRFDEKDVPR